MSTSYALSSFIKLDDIKALTKISSIEDVKVNYINEIGQSVNYIKDKAGNYLTFYLYDVTGSTEDQKKYVTSFDRFGSNDVQHILDLIEQECQVQVISEHEDCYESISKNSYNNFQSKDKIKAYRIKRTQTITDEQIVYSTSEDGAFSCLEDDKWDSEDITHSDSEIEELEEIN